MRGLQRRHLTHHVAEHRGASVDAAPLVPFRPRLAPAAIVGVDELPPGQLATVAWCDDRAVVSVARAVWPCPIDVAAAHALTDHTDRLGGWDVAVCDAADCAEGRRLLAAAAPDAAIGS